MDCSLPGSSDHGISQASITEWVAIPFSRDLPDSGIESRASALQADSLPSDLPGKLFGAAGEPNSGVCLDPKQEKP